MNDEFVGHFQERRKRAIPLDSQMHLANDILDRVDRFALDDDQYPRFEATQLPMLGKPIVLITGEPNFRPESLMARVGDAATFITHREAILWELPYVSQSVDGVDQLKLYNDHFVPWSADRMQLSEAVFDSILHLKHQDAVKTKLKIPRGERIPHMQRAGGKSKGNKGPY